MGTIESSRVSDTVSAPFAKILPAVIIGILLGERIHTGVWIGVVLCAVLTMVTWVMRRHEPLNWLLTYATIIMFGITVRGLTLPSSELPSQTQAIMMLRTTAPLQSNEKCSWTTARIEKYRSCETDSEWVTSGENIVLYYRNGIDILPGTVFTTYGHLRDIHSDGKHKSRKRVMWINRSEDVSVLSRGRFNIRHAAAVMQLKAYERLRRLDMPNEAAATTAAMSIGIRRDIPTELRNDYKLSGTSHLLAISGLHVGIVVLLVNFLLRFVSAFPRGHIIKNIIAIAVIWLYAFMSGLTPSVIRTSVMFTGFQASQISSRRLAGPNMFFATAAVMLLLNPDYLYDLSFQLSFVAVAGIIYLYPPIFNAVKSGLRPLDTICTYLITGLAATIATTPIISLHFGMIQVIGVLISPILLLLASVIMFGSLMWIIMPLEPLNKLFSIIIGSCAEIQNALIEICAAKSWSSLPIRMQTWEVIAIYAAIAIALASHPRTTKNSSRHGKVFEINTP